MTYAQRLRRLIADAGLTQTDIAEAAGLSKSTVSMYVSGKKVPNNAMAGKLADAIGVPVTMITEDWPDEDEGIPITAYVNVPVKVAAAAMGISMQAVRVGIQTGSLQIGNAIKAPKGRKCTYYISPAKLLDTINGQQGGF